MYKKGISLDHQLLLLQCILKHFNKGIAHTWDFFNKTAALNYSFSVMTFLKACFENWTASPVGFISCLNISDYDPYNPLHCLILQSNGLHITFKKGD